MLGEGLLRASRWQCHRHGAGGRHLRLLRGLGLPQPQVPADVSLMSPPADHVSMGCHLYCVTGIQHTSTFGHHSLYTKAHLTLQRPGGGVRSFTP